MTSNADLIRRAYAAFEAGGIDGAIDLFSEDFEVVVPPELSVEPDAYRGHDGIRRYVESFYEVMDEVDFRIDRVEERGDRMLVDTVLCTRARHTGLEAEQPVFIVWQVRDGRLAQAQPFPAREEAEKAL